MSRCWLALLEGRTDGADAAAAAFHLDGQPAGTLAACRRRSKPVRHALRVDERLIDPDGEPGWISLVLAPAGVRLPFDDLAVQQARRRVLARPPLTAVSTLLRDDSHFEGAITVARSLDQRFWLQDDPFARVFPTRLLSVEAGLLGGFAPAHGPDDRALRQRQSLAVGQIRQRGVNANTALDTVAPNAPAFSALNRRWIGYPSRLRLITEGSAGAGS